MRVDLVTQRPDFRQPGRLEMRTGAKVGFTGARRRRQGQVQQAPGGKDERPVDCQFGEARYQLSQIGIRTAERHVARHRRDDVEHEKIGNGVEQGGRKAHGRGLGNADAQAFWPQPGHQAVHQPGQGDPDDRYDGPPDKGGELMRRPQDQAPDGIKHQEGQPESAQARRDRFQIERGASRACLLAWGILRNGHPQRSIIN